jgi:hypothetical protein
VIFRPALAQLVVEGRKTVTRRRVKFLDGPERPWLAAECRYKVGRTYAVQPGRGKKAIGRIRILNVWRESSFGAVRVEWGGLRREGFQSYSAFEAYLRRLYGGVPSGPVDRIEFELVEAVSTDAA